MFRKPFAWGLTVGLLSILALLLPGPVLAAVIDYQVTIDTTSVNTQSGAIYLQFNPGGTAQSATAQILNWDSNATALNATPVTSGNVTGVLPGMVTFVNDPTLNDYYQTLTYGTYIKFTLEFSGDAVDNPMNFPAGSTFAMTLLDSGNMPIGNDPAFTIDLNPNGTTTVNNFSPDTVTISQTAEVPEPSSVLVLGSVLGSVLGGWAYSRRRAARSAVV